MMVPIPVGADFEVQLPGVQLKDVRCEKCGVEFSYVMHREATRRQRSWFFLENERAKRDALESAKHELSRVMYREHDDVPCPKCGWYQTAMLPILRERYRPWLRTVGLTLLVIATLLACAVLIGVSVWRHFAEDLNGVRYFSVAGALAIGGLFLIALRATLAQIHDPNAGDPQRRIENGKQRTFPRDQENVPPKEDECHRGRTASQTATPDSSFTEQKP